MNIKVKLIEQIEVLEKAQRQAMSNGDFSMVASISMGILEYIKCAEDDYVCEDCLEAEMKQSLHQDIAVACDLPLELVNRVLAGQDEILNMD